MERTDPKLELDTAKSKLIAQMICKEIKDSRGKNSKIYDLADRCERQYSQITNYMQAGKRCDNPWPGAADYFVPLTEWIIDAVWARVMQVLFSQEPYVQAEATNAEHVKNAPNVTDFVDTIFRSIVKIRDNYSYYCKQKLKLPFAVLKYEWVSDFEPMIVKEEAMTFINPQTQETKQILPSDPQAQIKAAEFMMNGYQQGEPQEVWALEDKEIKNSPDLRYIKFDDYVWSPNAKRGTRLYWEGDRLWLTLNDMRNKANQEKFIKDSVDKIAKEFTIDGQSISDKVIQERSTLRECYCWYGRFPFNKERDIDFSDPEAIEQEVVCIVDIKSEELLQVKLWDYTRLPYPERVYIRGEFEETEEFEGRSLAMKLYMTQKYLNQYKNTIMNNAWIAMQKIFVKRKTLQGAEYDKPEIYPGAMLEEDQTGDIRVLEVGDVKSIGIEIEQSLLQFAARISNIDLPQTGATRQGGQKTLGEIMATIKEGNIGMDKFIVKCHEDLQKISEWTVSYYMDRMPPDMQRMIKGETGETMFPTPENMQKFNDKGVKPYWTADNLTGKFNYKWKGTTLNSTQELNIAIANDLQDRYLPHPMIAGSLLAVKDILKRGLIARNIKDWEKILPKDEDLIAEMKRMQAESEARKQQEKMGANAPAQPEKRTPSSSISFKDLPLDGKIQLAGQAGIKLNPQLLIHQDLVSKTPVIPQEAPQGVEQ